MSTGVTDTPLQTKEAPSRRMLMLAGGGVFLMILAIVIVLATRDGDRAPGANDPIGLAKFVGTEQFKALSADQRLPYMQNVRKAMPQIDAARKAGDLNEAAYRDAYLAGWIARRHDDMQDYFKLPATKRASWLTEEFEKHRKKLQTAGGVKGSPDDSGDEEELAAAKDKYEHDFVKSMTADSRQRWEEFRTTYKAGRERYLAQKKGTPSTRP